MDWRKDLREENCMAGLPPISRIQALRNDDTRLFALKLLGGGELAAKEFDEAAGARAAVGAEKAHAEEKDEQLQNLRILNGTEGRLLTVLLGIVEERRECVVEFALKVGYGRLLVHDAGSEGFIAFGESL